MKKIVFAGLMALSAVVMANEDQLAKLDADKDGAVSQQEAAADSALTGRFKEADTNSDGKLDAAELGAIK